VYHSEIVNINLKKDNSNSCVCTSLDNLISRGQCNRQTDKISTLLSEKCRLASNERLQCPYRVSRQIISRRPYCLRSPKREIQTAQLFRLKEQYLDVSLCNITCNV